MVLIKKNVNASILLFVFVSIVSALSGLGCSSTESTDNGETGQQIADAMASIDESAGSTGNFSVLESSTRTFARLAPSEIRDSWLDQLFLKKAYATTCYGNYFSCNAGTGTLTRTFGGCTVGAATFSGTVTLTFTGTGFASCTIPGITDTVTRVPNYTVTGLRSATLSVTGASGQTTTRTNALAGTSATFSFSNTGGVRRIFNTTSTIFDFTTTTSSAITITGTSRGTRSISGGTLVVTNNLSSSTYSVCSFTPSSVTWGSTTCNCPTSGTWTGSCIKRSDSSTVGSSLTFNGCGSGVFAVGSDSEGITLDRCSGS